MSLRPAWTNEFKGSLYYTSRPCLEKQTNHSNLVKSIAHYSSSPLATILGHEFGFKWIFFQIIFTIQVGDEIVSIPDKTHSQKEKI